MDSSNDEAGHFCLELFQAFKRQLEEDKLSSWQ